MYASVVEDVMSRILPNSPHILTGCRLEEIGPKCIRIKNVSDNTGTEVYADWVVLAMGVRPRSEVAEEFRAAFENVYVVGDAQKSGRVLEATQDAHGKALVAEFK
jgi:thioredoxin reductase